MRLPRGRKSKNGYFSLLFATTTTTIISAHLPTISLEAVLDVPTFGNAGFEAFSIDGEQYLAAANFWDGESEHMTAKSVVYKVSWTSIFTSQIPWKGWLLHPPS